MDLYIVTLNYKEKKEGKIEKLICFDSALKRLGTTRSFFS